MERIECVVIGAGVVGLALARELALAGREVVVLEAEDRFGTGTSSRNSEVIHAGIYYPAGSLKARLCAWRATAPCTSYCRARAVGHRRCGKLIVAAGPEQLGALRPAPGPGRGQRRARPAVAGPGPGHGPRAAGWTALRPCCPLPPASSTATA